MRAWRWWGRRRRSPSERIESALKAARAGNLEAAIDQMQGQYVDAYDALVTLGQPPDTSWLQLAARLLFRSGRMAEAAAAAEQVLAARATDASTWNLLGRLRLWSGDRRAEEAFARAAALDPRQFVRPYRVRDDRFMAMAEWALMGIPAAFQGMLHNTMIVVDHLPPLDAVRAGEDPDLLGLYEGATVLEHGLPERIVLYQRNHENLSANEQELRNQVVETMRHEIGHHFGMEEDELPY